MTNVEEVKKYLKKNSPAIKIDYMIDNEDIEKVKIWGELYGTRIKGGTFSSFKKYFEHY